MDGDIMQVLADEIMPGETILWAGRPNLSVHFIKSDFFFVPFSIFWFGFSIFWTVAATLTGGAFGLFGIPFVLMGFYICIGRFILKSHRKRRTVYAITNKRLLSIMINSSGKRKNLSSADIRNVQNDSVLAGKQMTGSILFGAIPLYSGFYLNSGFDGFLGGSENTVLAFFDIDDPDKVYSIYKHVKFSSASL